MQNCETDLDFSIRDNIQAKLNDLVLIHCKCKDQILNELDFELALIKRDIQSMLYLIK